MVSRRDFGDRGRATRYRPPRTSDWRAQGVTRLVLRHVGQRVRYLETVSRIYAGVDPLLPQLEVEEDQPILSVEVTEPETVREIAAPREDLDIGVVSEAAQAVESVAGGNRLGVDHEPQGPRELSVSEGPLPFARGSSGGSDPRDHAARLDGGFMRVLVVRSVRQPLATEPPSTAKAPFPGLTQWAGKDSNLRPWD